MNTENNVLCKTNSKDTENQATNIPKSRKGRPGSKCKIIFFGVVTIYSGILYGFSMSQFSTFFEYFMRGKFGDSIDPKNYDSIQSLLNSLFVLGAFVFNILSPKVFQTQSLKKLKWLSILIFVLVNLAQIPAPLWLLYVLRFLLGFTLYSTFTLGPILVNHCLPSNFVGPIGSLFAFFIGFGVICGSSISSAVAQKYWYLFLCLLVPIELTRLFLFVFVFPYESPHFVYYQIRQFAEKTNKTKTKINNSGDATKTEKDAHAQKEKLRREFVKHSEIDRLVRAFYMAEDVEAHKQHMFENIHNYQNSKKQNMGVCKTMFSKESRRGFLISLMLNFANQFTGINVIILYAKQIYAQLGFSNPDLVVFIGSNSNQLWF